MRTLLAATFILACSAQVGIAETADNSNIEMAARINVAENLCDVNFGDRLLHHVMLGASELEISLEAAALLADSRHTEIVRFLNQNRNLDKFCTNARSGKL